VFVLEQGNPPAPDLATEVVLRSPGSINVARSVIAPPPPERKAFHPGGQEMGVWMSLSLM